MIEAHMSHSAKNNMEPSAKTQNTAHEIDWVDLILYLWSRRVLMIIGFGFGCIISFFCSKAFFSPIYKTEMVFSENFNNEETSMSIDARISELNNSLNDPEIASIFFSSLAEEIPELKKSWGLQKNLGTNDENLKKILFLQVKPPQNEKDEPIARFSSFYIIRANLLLTLNLPVPVEKERLKIAALASSNKVITAWNSRYKRTYLPNYYKYLSIREKMNETISKGYGLFFRVLREIKPSKEEIEYLSLETKKLSEPPRQRVLPLASILPDEILKLLGVLEVLHPEKISLIESFRKETTNFEINYKNQLNILENFRMESDNFRLIELGPSTNDNLPGVKSNYKTGILVNPLKMALIGGFLFGLLTIFISLLSSVIKNRLHRNKIEKNLSHPVEVEI
ncbi:MAG: hypothetical protein HQK54_07285 [Oligoflexales bacterium]|nr:hypothetical protein [Oligoflexales bacterium]